jgi:3-methyladenine DNA glycosylase AlkC
MSKEKFLLKDELFNAQKVALMANQISGVYSVFDTERFQNEVLAPFEALELKERIYHIRDMLFKHLPSKYPEALKVLLDSLPCELDPERHDDDFGDFIWSPYSEYVAMYGCNETYLEVSLDALREITKRFSVEFALRDFINTFPQETLAMLKRCAVSENYHERRLASEGLRPKLPWAKKLTIPYKDALKILDLLYSDSTRFVTRSVANHLNDIAKIDAPLVIETLKRWQISKQQESKEMDYMMNHALRTLVKQGHKEALALLGYRDDVAIELMAFTLTGERVTIGESLSFQVVLEAKEKCNLMVDYSIGFRTKQGGVSPKVHKLKKVTMQEGECVTLEKKHLFKAGMTTRKLYVGEHTITLQINGVHYKSCTFNLEECI